MDSVRMVLRDRSSETDPSNTYPSSPVRTAPGSGFQSESRIDTRVTLLCDPRRMRWVSARTFPASLRSSCMLARSDELDGQLLQALDVGERPRHLAELDRVN